MAVFNRSLLFMVGLGLMGCGSDIAEESFLAPDLRASSSPLSR